MLTPLGLTLKHVNSDGEVFYIAAHYVRHIYPAGRADYVLFDAGDRLDAEGNGSREILNGTVYIMNNAGKTIDSIRVGECVAPALAPKAA